MSKILSPTGVLQERFATLVAWLLVPVLVLTQFVDLRIGRHGRPENWSAFLVGFAVMAAVCLPWLLRRRALPRLAWLAFGSFALLLAWAWLRASQVPPPRILVPRVVVGHDVVYLPLATATVTFLAAWGWASAVPRRLVDQMLWWGAMTLAVTTPLAAARTGLAKHQVRLATGMGGSAAVHVVLLLAAAVLLASALHGHRTRASWAGGVLLLLADVATGSRAGLLCLGVFALLVMAVLLRGGLAKLALAVCGAGLAVVALLVALVPAFRRIFSTSDYGRSGNLETAVRVFTTHPHDTLFGIGPGRLWPWYVFETGQAAIPWKGIIRTGTGRGLTNPHSVFLGVAVELGTVGLVLLLCCLAVVPVLLVRRWRSLPVDATAGQRLSRLLPAMGLLATLPAFALDYYLFKNFAVTFWWWAVLALTLRADRQEQS